MADPILNPGEVEGTLRFTMETGTLYMDSGETRIEITDFVKGLTEAQIKATIQPLPKVYIAVDSKRLLVYDNDLQDWITIGGTGAVEWADYAGTASYANNAGTASKAISANNATNAGTAVYAVESRHAGLADTATFALNGGTSTEAEHAVHADTSTYAVNAGTSDHAVHAATSDYATKAGTATEANHAVLADTATYARNAGTADYATKAGTADYGTKSGTATHAGTADYATKSGTATEANHAVNADTATYARNAGTSVEANHAVNADTSTYATNAGTAVHAGTALHAGTSDYATKAGTATEANHAATAAYAVHATNADLATTALYAQSGGSSSEAEHATYADTATYAKNAGTATEANHAVNADTATYAKNAGTSVEANHAVNADTSTYAKNAGTATEAEHAVNADTSTYAKNAGTAVHAGTALHAGTSDYATKAGTATEANHAATAAYAVNAGTSVEAEHAINADTATYAKNAGTSVEANHAVNADTATYATKAGTAVHAGTSDYATKAGTATEANHAATATYAVNAGTAVHASTSDYATKATSADYATTAMYALNGGTSGDSQHATYADTATYAINAGTASAASKLDHDIIVDGISSDLSQGFIHCYICRSESDDPEKRIDIRNYDLTSGLLIYIYFEHRNTAPVSSLSIKLNNSDPIPIHYKGDIPYSDNFAPFEARSIYGFIYRNNVFNFIGDKFIAYNAANGIEVDRTTNTFYNTGIRDLVNSSMNGYITKNKNGATSNIMLNAVHQVQHSGNGYINVKTNGSTADVKLNAVHNINNSPNNGYIRVNTDGSTADVMLNAVHKIENSPTNGYMRVTTNGATSDVLMNGVSKIEHGTNGNIVVTTNGTTSNVKLNGVHTIANSPNNGYIRVNTDGSTSDVLLNSVNNIVNSTQNGYININKNGSTSNVMLNAVHKIENSPTNGYIRVTTNGSTSDVKMNAVHSVVKSGDNLIVNTNGTTSSITMDYAGRATDDESGNNIKDTYANSLSVSGYTLTLKNKNGGTLSTVNTTESKTIVGASNTAQSNAAATDGNVYLNHIENNTVKSAHNIKGNTIAVTSDANGTITLTNTGIRNIVNSANNGYININKNGTTSNIMLNAVHKIENSPTNGYMRVTTNGSTSDVLMNSVSKVEKVGDNLVVTTNGSTSSITMDYAGRATDDESGNNIKDTYANSLSVSGYTLTLKNKNGGTLSTVNTTESKTIIGAANNATANAAATNGNVFLNHIENNTVKSSHNIVGNTIAVTSDANGKLTLTNTGVRAVTKNGDYLNVNTNGSTANITMAYATRATNDESSNNIKATYANSLSVDGYTLTLKNKNGAALSTVNTTESMTVTTNTNTGTTTAAATNGNLFLNHIENNTVKSSHNIKGTSISVTSDANGVITLSNTGVRSISTGGTNGTITVNTNGGTAEVAVKGLGSRAYDSTSYLPLVGGTMSGNISFSNSGTAARGIYGTMADNDGWRIIGAGTADNAGYLEIATKDDASEPIYVRQYTGDYATLTRTATLLDASGNTSFPGSLTANSIDATKLTGSIPASTNSGVRAIAKSGSAGYINVNTNGTTANVEVNGAPKAIKSITRSGTTFTATALDGTTSSFTQQDSNTTYAAGTGIALNSGTFSNSGVRSIATGTSNGTINVNTNGSTANVAVKGLAALAYKASLGKSDVGLGSVANIDQSKAIKSITRSGTTFTATALDGTTSSFTQQDNNTTYSANNGVGLSGTTFYNSGVRSVATGSTNGTISVNTNGTAANVAVKGLGSAAYTSNDNIVYNNTDIPEGAANLSATANAHKITTYRNGLTIPYQMDNANDGGIIRCRGTSESNCIFEIGTWDDSGDGETIQFNYYPTTSQVTPTYSVTVPKKSGVIALDSDISTLRSNFQAGVDSVYNAIVAQGTTPASKSLSDVVTGIGTLSTNRYNAGTAAGYNTKKNSLTGTYTPGANGSKLDMGADHTKRYVDTRTVYNSGTAAGYNTKKNSLTGTYTPTGSGGSKLDMGADHTFRYVNTNTVYNNGTATGYASGSSAGYTNGYNAGTTDGYNTKKNSLTGTYTPTSNGSKLDMGADHTKRYVDTRTVYNSGTLAGYNTKKNSLTGTYTPTTSASALDMGADHTKRYVDTRTVYTNGYNAGTTAGYNTKKNSLTGTYTPTTDGSKLDMGADHTYRYINTNTVYNAGTATGDSLGYIRGYNAKKNSLTGTYNMPTPTTATPLEDMGADHTYRYVNATNVYNKGTATGYTSGYNAGTTDGYNTKKNSLTGTYTPDANGSKLNMGADHTFRYVDTRTVYNAGTSAGYTSGYSSGSSAGYTNGYNAGTKDGYATKRNELTGTYTPTTRSSNCNMGSNHKYRYVDTTSVPNNNDGGKYGITGSYATVTWAATSNYSGFILNVGLSIYNVSAQSANSIYKYNIQSNQKIIAVIAPDLRSGTSYTYSCTRSANTVTITSFSSNTGIRSYKCECLSGSTYVNLTCSIPWFCAIFVIGS